jgi:hypothetical protein
VQFAQCWPAIRSSLNGIEKPEAIANENASIIGNLAEEIDERKRLPEAPKRPIGLRPPEEKPPF